MIILSLKCHWNESNVIIGKIYIKKLQELKKKKKDKKNYTIQNQIANLFHHFFSQYAGKLLLLL